MRVYEGWIGVGLSLEWSSVVTQTDKGLEEILTTTAVTGNSTGHSVPNLSLARILTVVTDPSLLRLVL